MPSKTSSCSECQVCFQNIRPIFPVETELRIEDESITVKYIYTKLTQKNFEEQIGKSNEICAICVQGLVDAFLIIKKSKNSDAILKSSDGKDLSKIIKKKSPLEAVKAAQSPVKVKTVDNYSIFNSNHSEEQQVNDNKNDFDEIALKEMYEKRKRATDKFLEKHKELKWSCTIVRCRFCQELLFDYDISEHTKTCVDDPTKPKSITNRKQSNDRNVKKDNAVSLGSPLSVVNNSQTNHAAQLGKDVKNVNRPKPYPTNKKINNETIENNLKNKPKIDESTNELLLLCKICKGKLYMSEMEEHKKQCRVKVSHELPIVTNIVHNNRKESVEVMKKSEKSVPKEMSTSRTYVCQLCNKKCPTENVLMRHIMRHGSDGFKCRTCPVKFPNKKMLLEHERKHYTQKRLSCPICNKGFNSVINLQSHLVSHKVDSGSKY